MSKLDLSEAVTAAHLSAACYDVELGNGRPLVQRIGTTLHVSIRGTVGWREWLNNANAMLIPFERFADAKVHAGFYDVYASVRDEVAAEVRNQRPARLVLSGHSLGGAVAAMLATWLGHSEKTLSISLYTFGSPRPGNAAFHHYHDEAVLDSWAFLADMDPVPHLPSGWRYDRVGEKVWLDENGDRMGRVRGGLSMVRFWLTRWGWGDRTDHNSADYVDLLQALQAKVVGQ